MLRRRIESEPPLPHIALRGRLLRWHANGALDFRPLPPPTDEEVGVVLARIAARVQRLLKRRGFEASDADLLQADPVVEYSPALAGISSASIQGRIALRPRAGGRVWRVGADPDAPWVLSTAPRHAHLVGFDLHANVEVPAADRPRLEQLCRYLLRPAVAQDRLRLLDDGRCNPSVTCGCKKFATSSTRGLRALAAPQFFALKRPSAEAVPRA